MWGADQAFGFMIDYEVFLMIFTLKIEAASYEVPNWRTAVPKTYNFRL